MRDDMREKLTSMSTQNMAFTDCVRQAEASTEKKAKMRKDWRNRLGFFLKLNSSHSMFHLLKNRSYRPTVDDVNQWGQSLETLLSNKYGKAAFCLFLKSEFSEENIEFWTACEDFRTLTPQEELRSRASSIYEEFVKSEAPKEINLDFHTKNAIVQSLHEPDANIFAAAQRKVYSLMENNSYPRFIHSDLYRELCNAARRESRHIKP